MRRVHIERIEIRLRGVGNGNDVRLLADEIGATTLQKLKALSGQRAKSRTVDVVRVSPVKAPVGLTPIHARREVAAAVAREAAAKVSKSNGP